MQLQRAECPDTEDNDRGCRRRIGNDWNQEDTARTASLKRREPTVICSFRKSALLVEVPRGIAADRDTAVRTVTPTRTASRQRMNGFVEINTFIHSAPKQKSDEWIHLSPVYTRVHGEWLRYAKSTSKYSLPFSLKVRDDWGSQVNPLCRHDITRSDRQIGNQMLTNKHAVLA